jgi:hypothetical protein
LTKVESDDVETKNIKGELSPMKCEQLQPVSSGQDRPRHAKDAANGRENWNDTSNIAGFDQPLRQYPALYTEIAVDVHPQLYKYTAVNPRINRQFLQYPIPREIGDGVFLGLPH